MNVTVSIRELKSIDYGIIAELVKNPRLSDRQLSKILHVSQPTITRRRTALENAGLLEYTAIPHFEKLGFQILAFIFGKWNLDQHPDTNVEEMRNFIASHPNIIYISTGRGLNYDRMGIALFKDYSEYSKVIQEYKTGWGKYFSDFSSFIVSLEADNILRYITFKPLAQAIRDEHGMEQPQKTAKKQHQKTNSESLLER